MTETQTNETEEKNMHLFGVNIWMRMRTLCDVRRTSVINISGTTYRVRSIHLALMIIFCTCC